MTEPTPIESAPPPEPPSHNAESECETCNGDPEVCASVPGLRHCEKANREAQTDHIAREIVTGPGTAADGTVVLSGQVYLRAERMPPHNAEKESQL